MSGRRRAAAFLILLAGLLLPAVAAAPAALAHAALVGSEPTDGSRLPVPPDRVTLHFSERVSPETRDVRVVDGRGNRVDAGPAEAVGDTVTVPLRPGLGPGGYLLSYRVVSADSHPVSGAVTFAVGSAPLPDPSGAVSGGTAGGLAVAVPLARWVSYAGLVLLGGAVLVLVGWPAGGTDRRVRRVLAAGAGLAAAAAVAQFLLQGPYAAGAGLGSLGDEELLRATLALPVGKLLLLRLAALAALAALLARALPARARGVPAAGVEDAAGLAGFVVLFSHAAAGHAVADPLPTAAVVADVLHLAAMSTWLGGLVLVTGVLLRDRPAAEATEVLPRFSRLAQWSVAILVVTGGYRAVVAVGSPGALLGDPYGRLLLVKLAGTAVLVGFGAGGRRVVQQLRADPATGDGGRGGGVATVAEPQTLGGLRRRVAVEVAVAAVVLAVTALLVGHPQARTAYPGEATASVQLAAADRADLRVTPARAGSNTVRVRMSGSVPQQVELTAALPAEGLGPLRIPLERLPDGSYRSAAVTLPRPGWWTLTLRVRTGQFDATRGTASVRVH